MLLTAYAHRLPSDYDMGKLRERAEARGVQWDHTPGLYFKAFVSRERGRLGSIENRYGSIYLWRDVDGLRDLLTTPRFEVVTTSFGRPAVDTRLVIQAMRGNATDATFVRITDREIPSDMELAPFIRSQVEQRSAADGMLATALAMDTGRWRLRRVDLVDVRPDVHPEDELYQILHLSRPLLDTLPRAQAAQRMLR